MDDEVVMELPVLGGGAFPVRRSYLSDLSSAYPSLDVEAEVRRAKLWLDAHPRRQKKNVRRFLQNWMSRAEQRGGRARSSNEFDIRRWLRDG